MNVSKNENLGHLKKLRGLRLEERKSIGKRDNIKKRNGMRPEQRCGYLF